MSFFHIKLHTIRKQSSTVIAFCCLFLALSYIGSAEEQVSPEENTGTDDAEVLELEEITVTGLRIEKRLKDTPVITEVIDSEEIAESGASDLSGVLADYGIMSTQNSMGDYISLQGLGESRVLFLIDGRRVPGRVSHRIKGGTIPLGDIERIEIVRGAQSALYGSDGMGGVINIITKPSADNFSLTAKVSNSMIPAYNSEDTEESKDSIDEAQPFLEQDLQVNMTFGIGETSNKLNIEGTRGELYLNDTESVSILPELWRGKVSGETAFDIGDRGNLTVGGSVLAMRDEDQTSSSESLTREDTQRYEVYAESDYYLSDTVSLTTRLYDHFYERERQEYSGLLDTWDDPEYENENLLSADSFATIDINKGLLLSCGIEASLNTMQREWLTLEDLDKEATRGKGALVVQGEWYREEVYSLVAGLRTEADTEYGFMAAPRIAGMYRLTPSLRILSGAGLGYRAPDFNELYLYRRVSTTHPVISGNPDLKPEYSLGGNLGAEYAKNRCFLQANLYYTELYQEIVTDDTGETDSVNGNNIYCYENLTRSMRAGADLEGKINLPAGTFVSAGYNYLFAYNRSDSEELREEPAHTARIKTGIDMKDPGLHFDISGRYMSALDPDDSDEDYQESRYQIDMYGSWDVNKTLMVFLSLENLTGYINESLGPYYGQKLTMGLETSF
jgi:outer membrane receptor for ferrienterochelin and colicins